MKETDVRLTYRFLNHKDETEIRVMSPFNPKDVRSIFVYSEDMFVNVCRKFQNRYNIYVGINERRRGKRTADDVISLNAIVFDIDSIHPVGLPATESEIRQARIVAERLYDLLKRRGKSPYLAMSGNGWQIWLKVGVPIEDVDKRKMAGVIKEMQKQIMSEFSSEGAKIDNIGDLARVIKVIGTKAVKASTNEERVNRFSYWENPPKDALPQESWGEKLKELAVGFNVCDLTQINAPSEELKPIQRLRYLRLFSPKMNDLFRGEWKTYKYASRSEAEFALLTSMKNVGIPSDMAWLLMNEAQIGKWRTAKEDYRRLTIAKAYTIR